MDDREAATEALQEQLNVVQDNRPPAIRAVAQVGRYYQPEAGPAQGGGTAERASLGTGQHGIGPEETPDRPL